VAAFHKGQIIARAADNQLNTFAEAHSYFRSIESDDQLYIFAIRDQNLGDKENNR